MLNENATPATIHLKDYTPPAWLIDTVRLDVDIRADGTVVSATLDIQRNPAVAAPAALVLDGETLETLSVRLDGQAVAYRIEGHQLCIDAVPAHFCLQTQVRIQPDANTRLSGFYRSQDGYFTQCEPQGFRHITFCQGAGAVLGGFSLARDVGLHPQGVFQWTR